TWADRVLRHSPVGRAPDGSIVAKLRASLDQLPTCRTFIARFHRDAVPLLACQKVLTTRGLTADTQQECRAILSILPQDASVHGGFLCWMARQRDIAEKLDLAGNGLPVSSDPIESLFAVAKHHGTGELKDANQIARHVPALCGRLTAEDA